jgi:hypothetical protein
MSLMSDGGPGRRSVMTSVVNRRALTMVVLALPLITGAATAGLSAGWLGPGDVPVRSDGAAPSVPQAPRPADIRTADSQAGSPAEPQAGPPTEPAQAPQQPREAAGRASGGDVVDPATGGPGTGGGTGAGTDDGRDQDARDRDNRDREDRGPNDRGRDDRGRDDRDQDDRPDRGRQPGGNGSGDDREADRFRTNGTFGQPAPR